MEISKKESKQMAIEKLEQVLDIMKQDNDNINVLSFQAQNLYGKDEPYLGIRPAKPELKISLTYDISN